MNTNVEALKNLYIQLGNDAEDVKNCSTIVEVLNVIAGKYEGETDAVTNPDAIDNIAAVAENIGGGGQPQPYTDNYKMFQVINHTGYEDVPIYYLNENGNITSSLMYRMGQAGPCIPLSEGELSNFGLCMVQIPTNSEIKTFTATPNEENVLVVTGSKYDDGVVYGVVGVEIPTNLSGSRPIIYLQLS